MRDHLGLAQVVGLNVSLTIILLPIAEEDEEEFDRHHGDGQAEVEEAGHKDGRGGAHEELVGQGIEELAPIGDLVAGAGEGAVHGVGEGGEDEEHSPLAIVAVDEEEEDNRHEEEAEDGDDIRRHEARQEAEHGVSQKLVGVVEEGLHDLSKAAMRASIGG